MFFLLLYQKEIGKEEGSLITNIPFERALVVGGAGFIGSNIVDFLLKRNIRVSVIDNLSSGRMSNIEHNLKNDKFNFYNLDIKNSIKSVYESERPDIVFFLAAIPKVSYSVENPTETDLVNINGLVNNLEQANKFCVSRFIFSSSSSVYGGSADLPTKESSPLSPQSPYALQKMCGEHYCRLFSSVYGLDTVSLRYFNIFGPRQYGDSPYASVISAFCNAILKNTNPIIYGDGEQFRDFCYVDNVVYANLLSACHSNRLDGEVFNIGCGGRISVNDLCSKMGLLDPSYKEERAGDVKCSQASILHAKKVFGYDIITDFDDGLKKTIDWYLSR